MREASVIICEKYFQIMLQKNELALKDIITFCIILLDKILCFNYYEKYIFQCIYFSIIIYVTLTKKRFLF